MTTEQFHRERLRKLFTLLSRLALTIGGTLFFGMLFISFKNSPLHVALANEQSGKVLIQKNSGTRIKWQGVATAPSFDSKELTAGYEKAGYSEERFKSAVATSDSGDTLSLSWKSLPLTGHILFTEINNKKNLQQLSGRTITFKLIGLIIALAGALLLRFGFRLHKNMVSVTNWAWSVRGANRDNSTEKDLKNGFKRALKGEFP